jgi:CheY-like chemotaxis protein
MVFRLAVLKTEIRRILVVDPHDICLKLFTKALKRALPHASVIAVSCSEEALRSVHEDSRQRFDLIIVEERLKLFHRQHRNGGSTERRGGEYSAAAEDHQASGSALLRMLAPILSKSLLIGVSADSDLDGLRWKECGADFCWTKPPPPMNQDLLDSMLAKLLVKRGRTAVAQELFQLKE